MEKNVQRKGFPADLPGQAERKLWGWQQRPGLGRKEQQRQPQGWQEQQEQQAQTPQEYPVKCINQLNRL